MNLENYSHLRLRRTIYVKLNQQQQQTENEQQKKFKFRQLKSIIIIISEVYEFRSTRMLLLGSSLVLDNFEILRVSSKSKSWPMPQLFFRMMNGMRKWKNLFFSVHENDWENEISLKNSIRECDFQWFSDFLFSPFRFSTRTSQYLARPFCPWVKWNAFYRSWGENKIRTFEFVRNSSDGKISATFSRLSYSTNEYNISSVHRCTIATYV